MYNSTMFKTKCKIGLLFFQIGFLFVQFLLFYPCLVNAPKRIKDWTENEQSIFNVKSSVSSSKYQPTWDSLDKRLNPAWYDDAKIGIFIHWGVFSVPSFVDVGNNGLAEWFWYYWKGKTQHPTDKNNVKSAQEFINKNYPPGFQYADFAPKFTAEFFDPDQWANIFQASGARYVVLTSKHHEGFTLWPSKHSWNWNAVDNGPHRDLVGDLSEAVRRKGLRYGLYHSLYEWFNPLYMEDKNNNFTTQVYIKNKLWPELTDMVLRYKPDIVWTDGDWDAPCSYWNCTEFIAWLYNESPVREEVVVNDRWGKDVRCNHSSFLTCSDRWTPGVWMVKDPRIHFSICGLTPQVPYVEQVMIYHPSRAPDLPSHILDDASLMRKWENCMTIDKESWGYRRNAQSQDYYTIEELIEILADTVSKGGNLLMNIGPTADGRIIPIFQERLLQMGKWLKLNGESIYGTRPWKYFVDPLNTNVRYTSKRINGKLVVYAIILKFPQTEILHLQAPVPHDAAKVSWLGYPKPLKWTSQKDSGIKIEIPRLLLSEIPCQWAMVFKLDGFMN